MLFDLRNDPFEHYDIADQHPDIVDKLKTAYKKWDSEMMELLWEDPHIPNVEREEKKLQVVRDKASAGEK
jgi:hypothetical protein